MTESQTLDLFAEGSHVSPIPEQTINEREGETLETCQARLFAWWESLNQPSLLGKTPKALLTLGYMPSLMLWKKKDISARRSVFHLALLDYLPWNGMYGLLPRPAARDFRGTSKKRHRRSNAYKGNFNEAIRESESDGVYPNPEFVEVVKGFPEGWTDLSS